jgi:hypothetical protein
MYKNEDENAALPVKIEALDKQFKTHCCTLNFDHIFIKTVLQRTDSNNQGILLLSLLSKKKKKK